MQITVVRSIDSPATEVFATVADVRRFAEALPHVTDAELLTDQEAGVGTRFRETREMGGKATTTELEVTEYEPDQKVRMVTESHGTVWDSTFTVEPEEDGCRLQVEMVARAKSLTARVTLPLIQKAIAQAMERDLDLVKEHCERG